jgi:copper homeostasis protein
MDATAEGADRLELCSCLETGGLTPSIGLLREVISLSNIPVIALIRPRAGGFVYSRTERMVMLRDAVDSLSTGASGLAVGALLPEGAPDMGFLEEMRGLAEGQELIFHRAFDLVADMELALRNLAFAGIDRILTSGGEKTAAAGTERIRRLVELSDGIPAILPGGGVSPWNAAGIVRDTGCRQLHGSFSSTISATGIGSSALFPGGDRRTDPELIRLAREALEGL